jgi:hypothetical protein
MDLGKINEGGRLQQFGGPLVAIGLAQHGSPASTTLTPRRERRPTDRAPIS